MSQDQSPRAGAWIPADPSIPDCLLGVGGNFSKGDVRGLLADNNAQWRAALAAAPAAATAVPTKTDLARLWRDTNGSNRWPSDVDAFVNAWLAFQAPATGSGADHG